MSRIPSRQMWRGMRWSMRWIRMTTVWSGSRREAIFPQSVSRLRSARLDANKYSGELLLDQQKFAESVERFDKAIELDKTKKPRNVLPLVNKSLAIFQWKQDIVQAESLCREALEVDPDCDVAVATLAQLSLQQGKIDEAIKWFEQSGQLARTEGELINALTCMFLSSFALHCSPCVQSLQSQLKAGMMVTGTEQQKELIWQMNTLQRLKRHSWRTTRNTPSDWDKSPWACKRCSSTRA